MPNPLTALLIAGIGTALSLFLFWPEYGLYARWQRTRQMTERVLREDALKHIYGCEAEHRRPTVQSLAGVLHITLNEATNLLSTMEAHQLLERNVNGELCLSPTGREYALHMIRTHRLWEQYLSDKTGFAEAEWHGQAEKYEHTLSRNEADALSAQLGYPTHDPHGDPIPTASGQLVSHGGQPLTSVLVDQPLQIVHLEDEPETVYAQLVAEGLHPGMTVRLIDASPERVRFWAGDDEHLLAPIVAANISVVPVPDQTMIPPKPRERLSYLQPGDQGEVVSISPLCRGSERRRLMDLGIVPGTVIAAEMTSPSGDPTAYRVRDTLIALRQEQADLIQIKYPEAMTP